MDPLVYICASRFITSRHKAKSRFVPLECPCLKDRDAQHNTVNTVRGNCRDFPYSPRGGVSSSLAPLSHRVKIPDGPFVVSFDACSVIHQICDGCTSTVYVDSVGARGVRQCRLVSIGRTKAEGMGGGRGRKRQSFGSRIWSGGGGSGRRAPRTEGERKLRLVVGSRIY